MFILIAFWWGVVVSALKFAGLMQCSWWIVFGPMIAAIIITLIALMYISLMFSGSIKFWRI